MDFLERGLSRGERIAHSGEWLPEQRHHRKHVAAQRLRMIFPQKARGWCVNVAFVARFENSFPTENAQNPAKSTCVRSRRIREIVRTLRGVTERVGNPSLRDRVNAARNNECLCGFAENVKRRLSHGLGDLCEWKFKIGCGTVRAECSLLYLR